MRSRDAKSDNDIGMNVTMWLLICSILMSFAAKDVLKTVSGSKIRLRKQSLPSCNVEAVYLQFDS